MFELIREHKKMFMGIGAGVLAALCFAMQGILAKFAYRQEVSTISLLTMRYLVALPIFWVFIYFQNGLRNTFAIKKKSIFYCFLAGLVGGYASSMLDFYAMNFIDAGIARTIFITFPAFVIILTSIKTKQMPSLKHIIVFFIVQIGVFMITDNWGHNINTTFNMKGAFISLAAAFFYAVYIMINDQEGDIGSTVFAFHLMTSSTIFVLVHFLLTESVINLFPNQNITFNAIIFAIFGTFLPWIFFAESVRRLGGTIASLVSMLDPVFTLIMGYLLLDERLTFYQSIGISIIIISLCLLMIRISAIFSDKHELVIEDPAE